LPISRFELFGGPHGELAAACRYFTQAVSGDDLGRRDMLFDIATEESSHPELTGSIVAMLKQARTNNWREGSGALSFPNRRRQ
jgi:Mn-containing catalase